MSEEAQASPAVGEAIQNLETEATTQQPANDVTKPPANDNQPATGDDKRKQLEALAKELGMELDGATVSVAERAEFRKRVRERQAAIEREKQDFQRQFEEKLKAGEGDISFGRSLREAWTNGDYDAIARALGPKDWNELQEGYIQRLADPNHKRLLELESQLKAREAREQEEAQRREQEALTRQQIAARQQFLTQQAEDMRQSKDPILQAFCDDPYVAGIIFEIRRQNFDPDANGGQGATVSVEQALKLAPRGEKLALVEYLRSQHSRFEKAFSKPAAAPPARAKGKTEPAAKDAALPAKKSPDDAFKLSDGAERLVEAMRREAEELEEHRKRLREQAS